MSDVKILAIESSCDETAAAVVVNGRDVRSNVISSQIDIHTLYGGVVPEIASRKHIERINQVVGEALDQARLREDEIVAQAKSESAAIMEKAYRDIELEKKKARNELKDEISGMAVSLAEKVTAKEIDAEDHARLIDGFISSLESDR